MPSSRPADPALRGLYRHARRAAWVGLAVNGALAVVKVASGILGDSLALIADAVNSLGDSVTSLVVLCAIGLAQRPADNNHPYGHSRAEAVAALAVAVVIACTALWIGIEALRVMHLDHPLPPMWTLWVAGGNAVVKELMYRYQREAGRRAGSAAIAAGAWDHRSDALGSTAVVLGLLSIHLGGPAVIWADEVAALVVCAIIFTAAVQLFRDNASQLMDRQCPDDVLTAITAAAESTPGVVAVEQVRARPSGIEIHVDLHIEVDGRLSVDTGHHISHAVQRAVIAAVAPVSHVLVHIEPAPR